MKTVLVAHRGEPEHFPENSLAGFRAVLASGARLLETDVQLTSDGIPVLCHDGDLLRMTGQALTVTRTRWETIRTLSAGQPERFGDRFAELRITRLAELVQLLTKWPQAQAFIEVKTNSLDTFEVELTLDAVLACLAPVQDRCILISFSAAAVAAVGKRLRTGWVLPEWSAQSEARARQLAPDFLFVSRKRLPPEPQVLWQGPWQWAVYTVNESEAIPRLLARGIRLVETNDIRRLLAMPGLTGHD